MRRRHRTAVDLPVLMPFDAPGMFGFLAARAIPGIETANLTDPHRLRYARTLALPHGPAVAEVVATAQHPPPEDAVAYRSSAAAVAARAAPALGSPARTAWSLRAHVTVAHPADVPVAVSHLRRMLDLDADPSAADEALSADPLLAPLVAVAPGARIPGAADSHELAVRAVVGQQISVAAARTHLGRLAVHAGTPVTAGRPEETRLPGLTTLFPTAEQIARAVVPVPAEQPLDPGRPLRLPRRNLATIHSLAASLAEGDLVLGGDMDADVSASGPDPDALRRTLEARPGIGPWTAGYITMRVLGDRDVWLPRDAALAAAGRALGCPDDLDVRSARWSPWRSYAVVRLWHATAQDWTGRSRTGRT